MYLFDKVWQKPLQYCKVISLQLIKINGKKKKKKYLLIIPSHITASKMKLGKISKKKKRTLAFLKI